MLRAISLRESWMREIRTSGLTRERAPNGPSLLYTSAVSPTRVQAALQLRIPPRQNARPTPGAGPLSVYAAILRATARGNFRFAEVNPPVRLWFEKNQQIGF